MHREGRGVGSVGDAVDGLASIGLSHPICVVARLVELDLAEAERGLAVLEVGLGNGRLVVCGHRGALSHSLERELELIGIDPVAAGQHLAQAHRCSIRGKGRFGCLVLVDERKRIDIPATKR